MNDAPKVALRPFLPADIPTLAAIYRAAVEELTGEDYDMDQQEAWASLVDDEEAFGARLEAQLTLVAVRRGESVGFISVKDDSHIDLIYVRPQDAGTGVADTLCQAAEAIARGRGKTALSVDASDTALGFFQNRGFVPQRRNTIDIDGVWLGNTTLTKALGATTTEGRMLQ